MRRQILLVTAFQLLILLSNTAFSKDTCEECKTKDPEIVYLNDDLQEIMFNSATDNRCTVLQGRVTNVKAGNRIPGLSVLIRYQKGQSYTLSEVFYTNSKGVFCFIPDSTHLDDTCFVEIYWGSPFDKMGKYNEKNLVFRKSYDLRSTGIVLNIKL